MVDVGTALREARERSGLSLADVERKTRVRARYLEALERERFAGELERFYMRAFLVEYAGFVELDAKPLVEEFDRRVPEEPVPVFVFVEPSRRKAVLIAAAALSVLAVAVGALAREHPGPLPPPPPALRVEPPTPAIAAALRPKQRHARPAPAPGLLLVAHGRCWVTAYTAGRRVLYRTLTPGERVRLRGHRFWLRLGAPRNIAAFVGGRRLDLPRTTGNLVVTTDQPS